MADKINPQHYQNRNDNLQVIDVIEQFNLNFHRALNKPNFSAY